jgi:hypothetical protein
MLGFLLRSGLGYDILTQSRSKGVSKEPHSAWEFLHGGILSRELSCRHRMPGPSACIPWSGCMVLLKYYADLHLVDLGTRVSITLG